KWRCFAIRFATPPAALPAKRMRDSKLRVALVAGEASGDILGSGLMRALKARHPEVEFIGVGGPLMTREGLESIFPMERLAGRGRVEGLARLTGVLQARKQL